MAAPDVMDTLTSLCKRRGFIFQSSEIYGGLNGAWDYGPLGVELKRNIKESWWKSMVRDRSNIVGLDAAILMHPDVWKASGHTENFTDPMVDCMECKRRFRADHLESLEACPECKGKLTEVRNFNLMFKTFLGAAEETASQVYLRPETAQGIFVNFKNVQGSSRQKPPFGIAQIGKSFRNEINVRNFTYRSREFEQMEMQFFVKPGDDDEWFEYWCDSRLQWHKDLGVRADKLRMRDHEENELAHYAKAARDVEYEFPFGWQELEGVHNRTDFDLRQHTELSGKDLSFFDEQSKDRYVPYVVETAAGGDRIPLAVLTDALDEDTDSKGGTRTVLRLHPTIAPIKVAIFPLVKKNGMPEAAHKIEDDLRDLFNVFYDQSGAVGRRYRRQDEIGTPYCITVDGETLENESVTLRQRDSMEQERVAIADLPSHIHKLDKEYKRS